MFLPAFSLRFRTADGIGKDSDATCAFQIVDLDIEILGGRIDSGIPDHVCHRQCRKNSCMDVCARCLLLRLSPFF